MQSLTLNSWQLCDLEMLFNGGFAPLTEFMSRSDYECVVAEMRLVDGTLWPMPITLDVAAELAKTLVLNEALALRDHENNLLGTLVIEELWQPDKIKEAQLVFGTVDEMHPGVKQLLRDKGDFYVSGQLTKIALPKHYDFIQYRHTPQQLKERLRALGINRLVGFQTRNPMHRAHFELTRRAAKVCHAHLLIQPVVGMTKPGDVDYYTRARCYKKILAHYPETTLLNFLPLAMRMAGPREALWHMLIRKNYGCTHFIIGRDHAGPGNDSQGRPFYQPYAAQELAERYQTEAGIEIVAFQEMVYSKTRGHYAPIDQVEKDEEILQISGTELRARLRDGAEIPVWFSYPEVIAELRKSFPQKHKQGITLFFTGLSGAGKSTIANALIARLMEIGDRKITLLDGDVVRHTLSYGLGFSRQDRDANIARIGYVASEVTKHGGIAVCAPIAPYAAARRKARELVAEQGAFIEIYVATPLAECERRDPKGLYQRARSGELKNFTGVDDPYEQPEHAEIVLDTTRVSLEVAVNAIIEYLAARGYLKMEMVECTASSIQVCTQVTRKEHV